MFNLKWRKFITPKHIMKHAGGGGKGLREDLRTVQRSSFPIANNSPLIADTSERNTAIILAEKRGAEKKSWQKWPSVRGSWIVWVWYFGICTCSIRYREIKKKEDVDHALELNFRARVGKKFAAGQWRIPTCNIPNTVFYFTCGRAFAYTQWSPFSTKHLIY